MPPASERRRRLREAALEGARGRDWYDRAEREIRTVARSCGADPSAVAVAVAATSPATPVINSPRMARGGGGGSNIGKARRVVKAWNAGHSAMDVIHPKSPGASLLRTYEACERPASAHPGTPARCARDAFPSPEDTKTHAFVRNLLGDPDAVTVDRLVGRGAGIPLGKSGEPTISKVRYRLVVGDIRAVARELGWQPREVMAAAWTHWGGSGDLNLATTRERARSLRKRANGRRRGSMRRRNKRKHVGMLRGGLPRPSKPHGHTRTKALARRGKPVTDVSASYLRFYGVPVPAGFTTGTAEHKKMSAKPKRPRWFRERYGQSALKLTPRRNQYMDARTSAKYTHGGVRFEVWREESASGLTYWKAWAKGIGALASVGGYERGSKGRVVALARAKIDADPGMADSQRRWIADPGNVPRRAARPNGAAVPLHASALAQRSRAAQQLAARLERGAVVHLAGNRGEGTVGPYHTAVGPSGYALFIDSGRARGAREVFRRAIDAAEAAVAAFGAANVTAGTTRGEAHTRPRPSRRRPRRRARSRR